VAFGIASLAAARHNPSGSFAGGSLLGGIAELVAGWSIVAVGLLFLLRHVGNRLGLVLMAAGLAWFLPEWSNPGIGTALGFTVGLVGFVACAPLAGHAALAYPTGRLRSSLDVVALATSYGGALLLLGLLPAAVFDPRGTGCLECPRNLVLTTADSGLFHTFNLYGLWVGIGWLIALGALIVLRAVRSRRAAALLLPVLVPVTAYLALVAWDFQHSLARGILSNDSFDRRIWLLEAAALIAFAFGAALPLFRERRARASVANFVVELGEMPTRGGVRDALAQTFGDPTLELVYRRSDTGGFVDAFGHPLDPEPGPGRTVTPLLRGNTTIAALVHDVLLLDQPGLLQEVLAAARIAVENEQLQAEVRAQLEELRYSRARIVETGDSVRRRLERDLHDGAQQRLIALSYDLRLLQVAAEANSDPEVTALLTSAGNEAQTAISELRELAHGIYPAVLAEAGLAPALETLADDAPLPVELRDVTEERHSAPVETAAYMVVAEAVQDATERAASFVSVQVSREAERLLVAVQDDGVDRSTTLLHLSDRVGALGGSLDVGPKSLRAEIPCG
jgi:signal transduction histidine kinase